MGVAAVPRVFGCSSTGLISVDGDRQYSWSSVDGTSLQYRGQQRSGRTRVHRRNHVSTVSVSVTCDGAVTLLGAAV